MSNDFNDKIDILDIIAKEQVTSHFHPIISLKKKRIIGYEALCRGVDNCSNLISPSILFGETNKKECNIELDRLCRKKALESFAPIYHDDRDIMLFLNFDTSIIDKGVVGSGNLVNLVKSFDIDPRNIVIEIIESKVNNISDLEKFIEQYKRYGFLIALDDIGAGHSNLDRIFSIKPDVLKIDRSIISKIDKEYHKQEIFKSIINLAHKIGALVVSEGVETREEVITSLEYGADLFQGFYFCKPDSYNNLVTDNLESSIDFISSDFRRYLIGKINSKKRLHKYYEGIIDEITRKISSVKINDFDDFLNDIIGDFECIECLYILDENGIQITNTIFNKDSECIIKRKIFTPDSRNANQTLKDYYLFLKSGLKRYTTDSYISLATGNMCITISAYFYNIENIRFILCVDIKQTNDT